MVMVLRKVKIEVCGTPNQDNPMPEVVVAERQFRMDVWEHAYLHYQNKKTRLH
jgi:superoxide dismutase